MISEYKPEESSATVPVKEEVKIEKKQPLIVEIKPLLLQPLVQDQKMKKGFSY